MTLIHFLRIFNRNINLFLLCSIALAVVVYALTRNLPKEYQSETEIYTGIASGLNIDNLGSTKVDWTTANTEYDNLINIMKSRQTLQEVGFKLLVQHMLLDSLDTKIINPENYAIFKWYFPDTLVDRLLVPYSIEQSVANLRAYSEETYQKESTRWLFQSEGSPYSYRALEGIDISRVQSSDLLRIKYTWNDPGIVQNTLLIFNQVAAGNVANIKAGQSDDVVGYYRDEVNRAAEKLNDAEQALQDFRVANKVINYQEQTRSLAIKKEAMEDEYQKEVAAKDAAQAALERLNRQLAMNNVMVTLGNEILVKKKELVELRAKIAELETYYNDQDLLRKLKTKADKLEAEISNTVSQRYERSRTTDGIPIESIINEWLNFTLQLEQSTARLKVYEKRKNYFQEKYNEFAALGAKAARLERAIEIEESNYLETLYSLRQALLRQKSQKLSSGGLVVTEVPLYPLEPNPSKAFLLVLVGAIMGFIVPLIVVFLKEFIDTSIRTPERAESATGLKLLGAYPDLNATGENKKVDFEWLHEKATGLLSQNLRLEAKSRGISEQKPKFTIVFSTRENAGKQLCTHVMANELVSLNFRVMVLGPKRLEEGLTPYYDYITYHNDRRFVNAENISEIIPMGYEAGLYDYFFLIIDAVLINSFPINLIEQFQLSVCVMGAYRGWNRADKSALEDFENTLRKRPRLILNGVEPDFMQNVLGDIEKRRSWLRRNLKKLLSFQFRSIRKGQDHQPPGD